MKIGESMRQGDVVFTMIAKIPAGLRGLRLNGHILEGEATGHVHRIAELDQAQVLECGEGLYLSVSDAGVSIVHDEHDTLTLPAGDYEVVRQREHSPEEIRNVAD